jgi:hypothetical protein
MTGTEVREYGANDPSRNADKERITDDGRSVDAVVGTLDAGLNFLKSGDILRPSSTQRQAALA